MSLKRFSNPMKSLGVRQESALSPELACLDRISLIKASRNCLTFFSTVNPRKAVFVTSRTFARWMPFDAIYANCDREPQPHVTVMAARHRESEVRDHVQILLRYAVEEHSRVRRECHRIAHLFVSDWSVPIAARITFGDRCAVMALEVFQSEARRLVEQRKGFFSGRATHARDRRLLVFYGRGRMYLGQRSAVPR